MRYVLRVHRTRDVLWCGQVAEPQSPAHSIWAAHTRFYRHSACAPCRSRSTRGGGALNCPHSLGACRAALAIPIMRSYTSLCSLEAAHVMLRTLPLHSSVAWSSWAFCPRCRAPFATAARTCPLPPLAATRQTAAPRRAMLCDIVRDIERHRFDQREL